MDEYIQSQLILAALNITTFLLKPKGTFVAKVFRGRDISLLYAQLRIFFHDVCVAKPKSSRNSSLESFVVCRDFFLPEGYTPSLRNPMLENNYCEVAARGRPVTAADTEEELQGVNRVVLPFVACGDLSGFDSDTVYPLEIDGVSLSNGPKIMPSRCRTNTTLRCSRRSTRPISRRSRRSTAHGATRLRFIVCRTHASKGLRDCVTAFLGVVP